MTGGADCFVSGGTKCFVGTDFLAVPSVCHHPNLPHVPLHSCKWGNAVPKYIFLQLVWA